MSPDAASSPAASASAVPRPETTGAWRRLGLENRVMTGGAALGLVVMLAVARWLEPDPSGVGTHTQLGLPPTFVMDQFGVPCPLCGMTTSWAHTMQADLPSAFWAQPAGAVLALASFLAIPALLAAGLTGWYPAWLEAGPVRKWAFGLGIALLLTGWLYKLASVQLGWFS